ncbi:MAG: AAA family ATPase, partial [Prevotella sp.]|nr:AAA family ATPase [Prevotella sp.]
MERNNELRLAWDFVENTGHSIFLTGKAGTGKTTFLKTLVQRSRKRPIVVAPTGVAAINAGGVTIHSFFQLPLTPYVPGAKMESKFDFSREKRKIIASVDLLIIDEISMVRSDQLDAIDVVLRRFRDHGLPFGGVQLLMIGDLAQLTPVVTPEDERMLKPYYDTPYFFGSKALQQIDYVTIQLEHVYRQQDLSFIDILNQVRTGHPSQQALDMLNSRVATRTLPDGAIRLTTHNQLANFYNESQLQQIQSRAFMFKAKIEGTFPDYSYPTADTLVLKRDAQVMFVKNDPSGKHLYYNGRIGHVTYVDQNKILVLCEGDTEAIEVEPLQWDNSRYTLNEKTREIENEVMGTFTQYPLRLAWAITIHKSQGLTFDRAIIDANQSFAPGQVYVALSRCRTLEGMVLASPIPPTAILQDNRVDSYIAQEAAHTAQSIQRLPALKEAYFRQLVLELFDFVPLMALERRMIRLFADYFSNSHPSLLQLHKQTADQMETAVMDVSRKWKSQITH